MDNRKKTIFQLIGSALAILLLVGGATFILFLFGSLGIFPLYVTKIIPWLGISGALTLFFLTSGIPGPRTRTALKCSFLCVCLGCAVYVGLGAYKESLPSLDDRDLLLWQYQPFEEDNNLVQLEEEPTFRMDDFDARRLKLDGATALYPVYAAFVQAVYPRGNITTTTQMCPALAPSRLMTASSSGMQT